MNCMTTLNKIYAADPNPEEWVKLLEHLGKTAPDDELLPLSVVLEVNGLYHATWCLQVTDGIDEDIRWYAVWCLRQLLPYSPGVGFAEVFSAIQCFMSGEISHADMSRIVTRRSSEAVEAEVDKGREFTASALAATLYFSAWPSPTVLLYYTDTGVRWALRTRGDQAAYDKYLQDLHDKFVRMFCESRYTLGATDELCDDAQSDL